MFKLTVAQVDKVVFGGQVTQVTCPGQDGILTVLSHHAPLVTTLKQGELRIVDDEGKIVHIPVAGGVLEVGSNEAIVLL